MKSLVFRSLVYHWRTNLAVCLGVAAAVAVLGGALVVGDSVRGSLRDLALSRLGRTSYAISSTGYFREALADDIAAAASVEAAPLVASTGFVTHEPSRRRASGVLVYGVDERFWQFHGLEPREGVFVSDALAAELGASAGDVLLTRLQRPTEIPLESLFAEKEDIGRTVRLTIAGVLAREELGEFSLQPRQGETYVVFVPLRRLQRDLGTAGRVNTVVVAGGTENAVGEALRRAVTLDDLGVKVSVAADRTGVLVDTESGIISEPLEESARAAAERMGLVPLPVFTYLANSIAVGDRQIPYSLVSGIPLAALSTDSPLPSTSDHAIVLNEWAAQELAAKVGETAELEYFLWDAAAGLTTDRAVFTIAAIVPMTGLAADPRLAPEYPGITGAESLADWEPPFPIDLSRVRPQDEAYWDEHRTTPKAFVDYDTARELWATRYGNLTSLRFPVGGANTPDVIAEELRVRLRDTVTPASQGLVVLPVRRLALEASQGATNFGEYFTYFSFFIVVSALILAILFFRLGVEQRLRQIGILRASGYTTRHIRRLLAAEAAIVAVAGSIIGILGALGYAHAIVYGLKTWWVGAVGTTLLNVHVTIPSLLAGAAGGVVAAIACVLASLRTVARRSPRALLGAHSLEQPSAVDPFQARRRARWAVTATILGLALLTLGFSSQEAQAGAFFGAGAALLAAFLLFLSAWLRSREARAIAGQGTWALVRLGFRNAAFRPSRSILSVALVAAAVFIIVSVDAFRKGGEELTDDPRSGTGGYVLLAKAEVPLLADPNEPEGRDALLIRAPELANATFARFRLKPGEDASCLNLYRPGNPTIIAPESSFLEAGRFAFADSLAETETERANPWLLLRRTFDDGAVPVVVDATSLQYVLHASVGDTLSFDVGGAQPLALRVVASLRDSVLQGELIMGEEHFVRLFPGYQGFRYFLIDAPDVATRADASALAAIVERELEPFGVDAISTVERLDAFHRVENTYLSTFQALGGLGLVLGTLGLATVMFRNVLERRRELALLRAVGYNGRHVSTTILAETGFLLAAGLVAGAGCALLAIAPAWLGRGGSAPGAGLVMLVAGVVVAGVVSAVLATRAALSGSVLYALRAE